MAESDCPHCTLVPVGTVGAYTVFVHAGDCPIADITIPVLVLADEFQGERFKCPGCTAKYDDPADAVHAPRCPVHPRRN